MTRTAVGGLAAATFAVGLLVGLVAPGAFTDTNHDRLMADHGAAMGGMMRSPMGPVMMDMGSMMHSGSMMGTGAMPMMPAGRIGPADHNAHHASPGATR